MCELDMTLQLPTSLTYNDRWSIYAKNALIK